VTNIFINYRGEDSQTAAALIDRELTSRFGSDQVFLDARSIPAGNDFVEELLERVRACSVLLVMIGPRWLTVTDAAGKRRIDDPDDWVRREIAEALAHGLRVIPILTGDATLPAEADLPQDIGGLSRRQHLLLRHRYASLDLAHVAERIIESDPELAKIAARRQSSAGQVPQQLPAAVAHFAGRVGELATLTGLLRDRAEHGGTVVISAIGGTAGVGKTALAVCWGHQVIDRFPDGQLYVNLRGFDPSGQVMEPAEAVRRFLDALQVPPERIPVDLDAQATLYRSQLAGKRMLVVLDNARDTAQVRPLLPGTHTCLVVVTSRNQLTGLVATDGAHPINLDLLTPAEARELLARRLGPDRVAAEPEAIEEIITQCARLPLALAIVTARAATHPQLPLNTLARELRDAGGRLGALTTDDPHADVRAVFSWSYQALTPDAARLFRLLGLHPGPDLSAAAVASLAGLPASTVQPVLAELTQASLLVEHTPGRYTFHDLLRAYASDLAHRIDTDQHRHSATARMLDHYLHTAYTANRLLNPNRDPIILTPSQPGTTPEHPTDHHQALEWLTTEHAVLLATVDHAVTTGFDTHTWQLAWTLTDFLDRRGHWHDHAAAQHAAVAAARRLADPTAQARAHRNLAHAYIRLGQYDDANTQLRHALHLYRQAGDPTGQAHTHHILSYVWQRQGRHRQALERAQQALDLFRAVGHRNGHAHALNNVGSSHSLLGDHQQAIACCQQALALHQQLDNRHGQASTWDSLGYAHHHLGHHTLATACYQHALDLFRELGDRREEAVTLTNLGDAHHATGNPQATRTAWQQALTILEELKHPDAEQVRAKLAGLDTSAVEDGDGDAYDEGERGGGTRWRTTVPKG
jgi:tetratricopeptide (TPR) repeat protein